MTEKEKQDRYDMLFNLQDVLSLSIEKIRIFDDILLDDLSLGASLEAGASEDQRLNALRLVSHVSRLSLLAFEILEHVHKLRQAYELLSAVVSDLQSGKADPRCDELYQELFGGD